MNGIKLEHIVLVALLLVAFSGDPSDILISLPLLNYLGLPRYALLVGFILLAYLFLRGKNRK